MKMKMKNIKRYNYLTNRIPKMKKTGKTEH